MTAERKIFALFSPLSRGLEGSISLKTFLYPFDSKHCIAETVSSHTLLMPQFLLSRAHAANIVFPRNHSVRWLHFMDTRLPVLYTPAKIQAASVQWIPRSWAVKLPKPGFVQSLQSQSLFLVALKYLCYRYHGYGFVHQKNDLNKLFLSFLFNICIWDFWDEMMTSYFLKTTWVQKHSSDNVSQ